MKHKGNVRFSESSYDYMEKFGGIKHHLIDKSPDDKDPEKTKD